jgi:histidine triad (HIT) family protein
MDSCRFCKIIKGQRNDEEIIFEDENFIVLTDKFRQTSAGSICLLIPKTHRSNILELTKEEGNAFFKILNLISISMQNAYNCKGIRIWTAVNKEAGQSIFHCHIHIVPCRSIKDRIIANFPGIYDWKRRIIKLGNNKLKQKQNFKFAEKLRNSIKELQ